ncbi:hypothetical protein L2744_04885 [Shewanella profunda]|uniref:hypothetical protein n=1 Tax=Shewanella profunda TaxID=254793 RepID=UPI00200E2EFA|nr:hypothetical protein [Shewanella profunda]MCL1088953.1 hypothetical protein [Shewanella profunda]
MSKSTIISILLCSSVLLGAMYFGSWTKAHSLKGYVGELTAEIRQASAVIEPKKPNLQSNSSTHGIAVVEPTQGIWDQQDTEKKQTKSQSQPPIFNRTSPTKTEDDEALSNNISPPALDSGVTLPETSEHKPV